MGVLGHGPSLGLAFVVGLCISLYVVRADLTSRREEACSRSFRTVWVNGSHWEAGRAIGEALRTEIKDFLATPYARKLVDFCSSSNGTRSCARWVSSANSSFPWTITELEATAAGAGVGVADLFAVNLADEIHLLTGDFPHVASACSTLLNASGGFIAHNEDGGGCLSPVGDVAMVVSTGVASLPVQTNAPFAALVYPGMLPGYAFGVNGNGVGLTVNSEFVKAVDLDGVPNSFVARALLAAPTAEHAAAILADTKLASGFTANLGSVSYPTTLVTVEAAALYGAARRLTQPWTAAPSAAPWTGCYVHFNQYRVLAAPEHEDNSSAHRLATAQRLLRRPGTTSTYLLGDMSDSSWPIYRDGVAPDDCTTLATATIDFKRGKLRIVEMTNPTSPEAARNSVAFTFGQNEIQCVSF